MFKEFKEFAVKGNVIDLAVGVIIGAAFGKIVESLVVDMIMPVISALFGQMDFSSYFWVLGSVPDSVPRTLEALRKAGVPVLSYGNFITVAINFLILAFAIFLMIKQLQRLKNNETSTQAPENAPTPEEVLLLREIRDQLQKN
ncbi:MAG: large conductance mechanosensitive channel protein MscL [Burkholderiales bacterium]|nr:large conductance mechanosensitive channel protein MscL [Burkholderiales bacterium]